MLNLVKENALFNEMLAYTKWEQARASALEAKKEQIIKNGGRQAYDSEEYKKVRDELNAMKESPYTGGAWSAWRCVYWSETEDDLWMKEAPWDENIPDFIDTLRKFGVTTFIYTDSSTALMRNIHSFIANGCEMVGIEVLLTPNKFRWGDDAPEFDEHKGLRFNIK